MSFDNIPKLTCTSADSFSQNDYMLSFYDDDYVNDEFWIRFQNLKTQYFKYDVTIRKRKHIVTEIKSRKIKMYVLYYMLYKFITNPEQWRFHSSNEFKGQYQEFISRLKNKIRTKFYLEQNLKIENDNYFKTFIKNKISMTVYSMRHILKNDPTIYKNNISILEHLLTRPLARTLYTELQYYKCEIEFKKIYGKDEIYPVKKIGIVHYMIFINFIKKSLL